MRNEANNTISGKTPRSLLQYACLAPSSHNTQPWQFHIDGHRIALYADKTRALPVNDPEDRELAISCGCALMNLRIAADHAGYHGLLDIVPEPDDQELLAVLELKEKSDHSPPLFESALFDAIRGRRTHRKHFKTQDVPTRIAAWLTDAAASEGGWLQTLDQDERRHHIADLVAQGDSLQWSNPAWRRELAAWLRPRGRCDGLTLPALTAPIAKFVVRSCNMGKKIGASDKKLALQSPLLAVLGTDTDNIRDWLTAGQALQRVLLTAYTNGLQASYLNQPLQEAALRPELRKTLGLSGWPQILLRLGFPAQQVPRSPRRKVKDVTIG